MRTTIDRSMRGGEPANLAPPRPMARVSRVRSALRQPHHARCSRAPPATAFVIGQLPATRTPETLPGPTHARVHTRWSGLAAMASVVDRINESRYPIEVVGARGHTLSNGLGCLLFEPGTDSGCEPYIPATASRRRPPGFRPVTRIISRCRHRSQSAPAGSFDRTSEEPAIRSLFEL